MTRRDAVGASMSFKDFLGWLRRRSPASAMVAATVFVAATIFIWVTGLGQAMQTACHWTSWCDVQLPPKPAIELASASISRRVYFDFNKSNITAEAQSLLIDVAKDMRANPDYDATIQAFSDTLFDDADKPLSDQTMQAFADRRAQAVEDELVRDGIRRERIGIKRSVIATADREPISRTAIVNIGPPK